jgi:hypothetical protein
MSQADSKNITFAPVSTRRRFLTHAASGVATASVLALASAGPLTAAKTAPARTELDAAKASPALGTAIAALNESFDRLEAARAVFTADDLRMAEWSEMHPEPKNRRALKKHWRKWREMQAATTSVSWKAQIEAETDFQKAQVAVANVAPRDHHDIMVKAATSLVYDRTEMVGHGMVAIIGYSVASDLLKEHMAIVA